MTITDREANVQMTLSKRQKARLENIIKQAEMILREASASETRSAGARKADSANTKGKKSARTSGSRRTAADAAALRKEILAARKKGAKVAELAEKYGVTRSYIYQMR